MVGAIAGGRVGVELIVLKAVEKMNVVRLLWRNGELS